MRKEIRPGKLRDMVRSILPSKNREAAGRAKRQVKRRVRRTVRHDLRAHETTNRDLFREARIDVQWRRDGDKLNHFMRWCRALTRGMPKENALSFVRAFLPRNVIGDHAWFHWESELRPRFSIAAWKEERRRAIQSTFDRAIHVIRRAIELDPAFIGNLNRLIKSRKKADEPRRLLHGMHDIQEFVRTILFAGHENFLRWPEDYAVEKKCVVEMVAEVETAFAPKRGLALTRTEAN